LGKFEGAGSKTWGAGSRLSPTSCRGILGIGEV